MTVYQAVYLQVLTYGAENWILDERQTKRLQSSDIRQMLTTKSLRTEVEEKKLKWWRDFTRMNESRQAMRIVHSIPPADVYILESKQSTGPNRNQSKATPYTHQLELTSMLIALLNTHHECNLNNNATPADLYPNRVYYLRNRLPARLFGALVGTERVSIENTILSIISGATNTSLPCSRLTIDPVLIDNYYKCLKGYKDLLGQALLLVITFMELCVYNNPESLKLIRK
ncbi:hypothetical protein MML48_1g09237 [Holotrichia oblita]|uniref:Uncharacterized protein n=1 Tax=Holotrichia oblita TaxID=644536 RepID=A0ACB9TV11_HOLOL|nr:hypothetical protein MML48_1g09237 [Holotrichia oblita]